MPKGGMLDESCKVQAPSARSRRVDGRLLLEASSGAMGARINSIVLGIVMVQTNDMKLKMKLKVYKKSQMVKSIREGDTA